MNQCGECTVCCEFFNIQSLNKPAGVLCSKCTGKGCGDYDNRPADCSSFKCAFLDYNWDERLRPDRCGVLVWGKGHLKLKAFELWEDDSEEQELIHEKLIELSENYEIIAEKSA